MSKSCNPNGVVVTVVGEYHTSKLATLGEWQVARANSLGLSGYGESIGEAQASLRRLFQVAVRTWRERGQLGEILNRSGLDWQDAKDGEDELILA